MKKLLLCLFIATLVFSGTQSIDANPSGDAYSIEDVQYIYVGNQYLELMFQKWDGELYGIRDKATNVEFIDEKSVWWSLYDFMYYQDGQVQYVGGWIAQSFSYTTRTFTDSVALDLRWDGFAVDSILLDVSVSATIEVRDDSPLSYWTIAITNSENITIEAVDFPALNGLGQISTDPEQDYLVYPSMTGLLFQNPLGNFIQNSGWGWEMYYPSAYATMQFMAYYGLNPQAGLYIASYDSRAHNKFINFGKPDPSWLTATIRHIPEFTPGNDYHTEYQVVVGVFSGSWYDAAQIYRTWSLQQPWLAQGTLLTRSDIPAWYRSAGLRQWIFTHPICLPDFNMFSIVPEVISDTATYMDHPAIANWIGWERQGWYLEYPDVFPPKEGWDSFRQAINQIHTSGNRVLFVPNTTSYSELAPSWSNAEPSVCRDRSGNYPTPFNYSECGMTTTFYKMCPGTSFWQSTLDSMLSTLSQENADVILLDGFPIFGPQPCVDTGHEHPNGGGTWWYDNYQQIFSSFKITARQSNPDLVLSSEGMAEVYIPLLDSFWDPFTTGWSPNSTSSGLSDPSKVQLIPLWHTVYHDYGFLESGISFVSRHAPSGAVGYGDYRDYYVRGFGLALVWGEMPTTWYADEKMSELDEQDERDMANYLRRIVDARTSYAQSYLMYGRMLRPPVLNVPVFHISGAQDIPYTLEDYPPFDSPAILSSAWKGPAGDAGYIFTNISHDPVTFTITVSSSKLLLPQDKAYTIVQNRNGYQSTLLLDVHLPQTITIQTDPLDIVLIKALSLDHKIYLPVILRR